MTWRLKLSSWVYRALLLFFPGDLRDRFGDEMNDAFTEDLARAEDIVDVASVWSGALAEIVTVAIPGRLAQPFARSLMISLVLQISIAGVYTAILTFHDIMPQHVWHGVLNLHVKPASDRR
jgi:hypothetical protein